MQTWVIGLEKMEFFARHGWYPEEQVQGNTFWVDIMVEVPVTLPVQEEDLAHTLNYEIIYAIVSRQMEEPVKLLETLCSRIHRDLQNAFGDAIHGHITVRKKQPPMLGKTEASLVTLRF